MKRLISHLIGALCTLLWLCGCGASQQLPTTGDGPHPLISGPRADIETMPSVEFCCDEIAAGLAASGQNPMWRCDDCLEGNTSTDALGAFPAILAQKPNVVVFIVGTWDTVQDYFSNEDANDMTCGEYDYICLNLTSMISQAQAAGAKVIVTTIPPFGAGPAADVYNDCCNNGYEIQSNQLEWDTRLVAAYPPGNTAGVTLVDIDNALADQVDEAQFSTIIEQYIPAYTTDGISPNATGYAVIEPLVNTAITAFHVGSGPR